MQSLCVNSTFATFSNFDYCQFLQGIVYWLHIFHAVGYNEIKIFEKRLKHEF